DLELLYTRRLGLVRWPPIRFWGAGLETPNAVRALWNGSPMQLLSQQRQVVAALAPSQRTGTPVTGPVRLDLEGNGNVVGGCDWTNERGLVYVPSDLGNSNAHVVGGFDEIVRVDGRCLTCDAQNGALALDIAVRKVLGSDPKAITLEFTRSYTHCH